MCNTSETQVQHKLKTKEELTQIIRELIDPNVNDVQQARHLGHQKGWYILSGTRRDNEAIEAGLKDGDYWLKTLEEPYPGYNASRRIVTEDFDELKAAYEYRCACCGSKEGEYRSTQVLGKVLWQEHLSGNIRQGRQGLETECQGDEAIRIRFGRLSTREF